MSKSEKKVFQIRQRRTFSEEFKRQKVQLIVDKTIGISDVAELYGVSKVTVYRWIYQYSPHHKQGTNQVVQMESEEHKTKQLLQKLAETERLVGQQALQLAYLERLITIAGESLNIDLKKNFSTSPLNGSETTQAKPSTP
jgi:transposase-like protein